MNNDGDTDVAGVVIERSAAPVTEAPTEREVVEPAIIRPRRRARPEPEPTQAPPPPVVTAPAAEEPVSGPVGLIRDPAPTTEPEPTRRRDRDRGPEPEPEPTPKPEPEPEPEPDPTEEPEPDDTSRFALRSGEGLSRDTALATEQGNSGKWNWQIRSIGGQHNQDAKSQRSRKTMARLEVGFNQEAVTSKEPVRDFRCDALLTAGSRRLVTDADHVFEISLWTTDGYALLDQVGSILLKKVVDLDAGEQATLYSNVFEDLDAADGVSYTCKVTYQKR